MRRGCCVALFLLFACEDKAALRLAECKKEIFESLDKGWLANAGSELERCEYDLEGPARDAFHAEVAKKIRDSLPAIKTDGIQSKPREPYYQQPIDKMIAVLAKTDAELPAMLKALDVEIAAGREARALAQAKADAEAAKDRLVIYREGFEDEDLEDCVNAAIAPLIEKAPVLEMKGPVPSSVLDAASGSIGIKTEVDFATYTEEGGGQPKAHVLRGLKITVTPRLKKKKLPPSFVVELGRDTPSSISGSRGESATGKAAQMQLDNLRAVWAQACAELKAKIH